MPDNTVPPTPPVRIALSREEASDRPTLLAALSKVNGDWTLLDIEGVAIKVNS